MEEHISSDWEGRQASMKRDSTLGAGRYLNTVPKRNSPETVHGSKREESVETLPLPGFEELLMDCPTVPKGKSDGSKREPVHDFVSNEFEDFWGAYPVKRGKNDAERAFRILRKSYELSELITAYNGYMEFLKDKRVNDHFEQAPMYPATFLRKERWLEYRDYKYKVRL